MLLILLKLVLVKAGAHRVSSNDIIVRHLLNVENLQAYKGRDAPKGMSVVLKLGHL